LCSIDINTQARLLAGGVWGRHEQVAAGRNICCDVFGITTASAQAPSLAGKNVTLIIGSVPAAPSTYGPRGWPPLRQASSWFAHSDNQNVPGAGSLNAANYIYNVAPKDGTVIGFISGAAASGPIMGASGARFDPTKLIWLGSATQETAICVAYNSPQTKVKMVNDLFEKEFVVGATGPGSGTYSAPKV